MIGKLLGAFIGNRIDRSDGEGGAKGAIVGAAAPTVLRGVGRLAVLVGGVYVAKKLVDKARGAADDANG